MPALAFSRSEAVAVGARFYFTKLPCHRGNIALRRTKQGTCVCAACRKAVYDQHKGYLAGWLQDNPNRAKAIQKRFRETHADRERQRKAAYKRDNPAKTLANTRWRQTLKAQATPLWVDRVAIEAVYAEAKRLERETGVPHHVDHIIPLRGKAVRGLHVPWNLQAIPALENYRKAASCPA